MLYLKRLIGNKINVITQYVDISEFLGKMTSFATETVNIVRDEITYLTSGSKDISTPRGWLTPIGDAAKGLLGIGSSITMNVQKTLLYDIPNDIIDIIDDSPVGPYVPTTPIKITLITGETIIVVTDVIVVLGGYGIINSIPGARDTQPQLEEIYLSDEQIMQSCIKVIHKINNLAKMTFGWDDYFWNNAEPIRNFITGETTIDEFLDTTRNAMSSLQELSKSNFPSEPNKYVNLLSLGIQAHKSNLALKSFMEDPTWHRTMKKLANGVFSI